MNIKTINITLKAVTPIVMSGPDPQNIEFRITEIKGMLRYWYRIRHFDEWGDLETLKDKESEMWGSTEKASKVWLWGDVEGEVGKFCLAWQKIGRKSVCVKVDGRTWGLDEDVEGVFRYWYAKTAYPVNTLVNLRVLLNEEVEEEFFKTLWAMLFLGGVGRRWKRGLGMLDIVLDNSDIPDEYRDYFNWRKRDDVNEFYCAGMNWVGISDLISVHRCMNGKREMVYTIVRVLDEISDVCVRGKGENKRNFPIATKWFHVLENGERLWLVHIDATRLYRLGKENGVGRFLNCHAGKRGNVGNSQGGRNRRRGKSGKHSRGR